MFTAIEPSPGLSTADRRRASRVGPPSVALATSYPSLLASAGFEAVDVADRTAAYRDTMQAWIDAIRRHEAAAREILGDEEIDRRLGERAAALTAIDDGLLLRRRYAAIRPGRHR